jgi:hypothetical protein
MDEHDVLTERFEAHRARLRAVAYQILGSASEADDAVQEAWLRLSRADPGSIENLGGWLTDGKPITLVAFTIISAKIVAIDLIDDPNRVAEADLAILGR